MFSALIGILISLLTTQIPTVSTNTGENEFGVQITTTAPCRVTALRFYKESKDPGPHTGHLWSSTGQLLSTVSFVNETSSGWQQQAILPVAVVAGGAVVVSVNSINGAHYAIRSMGFTAPIINGILSATGGLIGTPAKFPTTKSLNNYFRDIVCDTTASTETVSTGLINGTAATGRMSIPGFANGLKVGNYTVSLMLTDANGLTVSSLSNLQVFAFPFISGDGARSWAYTWVSSTGESLPSDVFTIPGPLVGGPYFATIGSIALGPIGTIARNVYRTAAGSLQLKLVGRVTDNVSLTYDDHVADVNLGVNAPITATISAPVNAPTVIVGPK